MWPCDADSWDMKVKKGEIKSKEESRDELKQIDPQR